MNLTNYLENKLVDHVLRKTTYTSPTNVYVALHTGDPTEAGNVGEASFSGYARKQLTLGAPSNGISTNTADLSWDVGGNVTISHVTIWDAATSGNPLFYGALDAAKTVASGDIFRIPTGSLTVGFD